MSAAAERHVRVTITGTARPVDQRSDRVLRVTVPQTTGTYTVTLDAGADGVTVEDVQPQRTWTEGDVVAGDVLVYRRGSKCWLAWDDRGTPWRMSDADMTTAVDSPQWPAEDRLTVLRYQAGGQ